MLPTEKSVKACPVVQFATSKQIRRPSMLPLKTNRQHKATCVRCAKCVASSKIFPQAGGQLVGTSNEEVNFV